MLRRGEGRGRGLGGSVRSGFELLCHASLGYAVFYCLDGADRDAKGSFTVVSCGRVFGVIAWGVMRGGF